MLRTFPTTSKAVAAALTVAGGLAFAAAARADTTWNVAGPTAEANSGYANDANWTAGSPRENGAGGFFGHVDNGTTFTFDSALPVTPNRAGIVQFGQPATAGTFGNLVVNTGASGTLGGLTFGGPGPKSSFTMNGGTITLGGYGQPFAVGGGDADATQVRGPNDHVATVNGGTLNINDSVLNVGLGNNNNVGFDGTLLITGGSVLVGTGKTTSISNVNAGKVVGGVQSAGHGMLRITGGSFRNQSTSQAILLGSQTGPGGSAIISITGGTFEVDASGNGTSTYPFTFTQAGGGNTYVDIAGGKLILDNVGTGAGTPWTAASLLAIPSSDFRANGTPLTAANAGSLLSFDSTTTSGFTIISSAVPEPASVGLLGLGSLGLLARRRRRPAQSA